MADERYLGKTWRELGGEVGFHCKECTDRYPGCHDKCEKYLEAKALHKEFTNRCFQNKVGDMRMYRYRVERNIKEMKKKGR